MKTWLKKKSNWFTLVLIAFVLWRQVPILMKSMEAEGVKLEPKTYFSLAAQQNEVLFPPKGKVMAIFWATWCGPCKLEMQRLKNSNIDQSKIFAINPFEDAATSKKFIAENDYKFTFIDAPTVTQKLNIQFTPTTLLLDDGKIKSMSTGMSYIGIWKAQWFIN